MVVHRTTLILDDPTRAAARDLAHRYGCSTSEAIRRAVVQQRAALTGVSAADRKRRMDVLKRLFVLFEDVDPDAEIRRLKAEDPGF